MWGFSPQRVKAKQGEMGAFRRGRSGSSRTTWIGGKTARVNRRGIRVRLAEVGSANGQLKNSPKGASERTGNTGENSCLGGNESAFSSNCCGRAGTSSLFVPCSGPIMHYTSIKLLHTTVQTGMGRPSGASGEGRSNRKGGGYEQRQIKISWSIYIRAGARRGAREDARNTKPYLWLRQGEKLTEVAERAEWNRVKVTHATILKIGSSYCGHGKKKNGQSQASVAECASRRQTMQSLRSTSEGGRARKAAEKKRQVEGDNLAMRDEGRTIGTHPVGKAMRDSQSRPQASGDRKAR